MCSNWVSIFDARASTVAGDEIIECIVHEIVGKLSFHSADLEHRSQTPWNHCRLTMPLIYLRLGARSRAVPAASRAHFNEFGSN